VRHARMASINQKVVIFVEMKIALDFSFTTSSKNITTLFTRAIGLSNSAMNTAIASLAQIQKIVSNVSRGMN
jgi:hypothetical protein